MSRPLGLELSGSVPRDLAWRLWLRGVRPDDAAGDGGGAKRTVKAISRLHRLTLARSLAFYRDTFDDANPGIAAAYATGDYVACDCGCIWRTLRR